MKIRIDTASCSGQARCAAVAGSVYVLDNVGYNATEEMDIDETAVVAACRGALACPEGAISIVDENGIELDDAELRKRAQV